MVECELQPKFILFDLLSGQKPGHYGDGMDRVLTHETSDCTGLTEAVSCWAPGGYCLHWRGAWMGNKSICEQLQFTTQHYTVN